MNFYVKYKDFLRMYVDKKYLQQYKNVRILAENFVGNSYIVLFETQEDFSFQSMPVVHRFILVENVSKPIISELKLVPNSDGYITMNKSELSKILGEKQYKHLAERGLAMTEETALSLNNRFCWHRLVACVYYNCLGKEVHHINKAVTDNNINNLVPLKKSEHQIIENMDAENGKNSSLWYQEQEKLKIMKQKRKTVASNDNVIEEIIKCFAQGYSVSDIVKKLNRRVKKSSVYKIIGRFHYVKEFLFWLDNYEQQACERLNGNSKKRWEKVIEFENRKYRT